MYELYAQMMVPKIIRYIPYFWSFIRFLVSCSSSGVFSLPKEAPDPYFLTVIAHSSGIVQKTISVSFMVRINPAKLIIAPELANKLRLLSLRQWTEI